MDDLYRENILEHYKRPHNWGELESFDLEAHDLNPLCGDELTVQLKVDDDGRVQDIAFSGHGCAISQAAASMTSDEIKGMKVDELLAARPVLRARPARDRHLRHPRQVRAAVAQGAQERQPRPRRRLGAGDTRERPGRVGPANPIIALGFMAVPEVIEVCPVEDLQPGAMRLVEWEDLEIGVFNCAGTVYAIEDRCSHDEGTARRWHARPGAVHDRVPAPRLAVRPQDRQAADVAGVRSG